MGPKVSVIIPTYNSAQYIAETLESVFVQTYKDYEIIVVDDGSNDNTKEVLQPYMSRIRYIYKENGGPSSARNIGIKNANGEYIAFLDSDDIWLEEKLEKQMRRFQSEPDLGLVYSNCIKFEEANNKEYESKIKNPLEGNIFLKLLEENVIPTSTVIVRKICFNGAGYFDNNFRNSQDYDMWLRISRLFKVGYVKGPITRYRVRTSSISRSANLEKLYNMKTAIIEKNVEYTDNSFNKKKFLKKRFYRLQFECGMDYFNISNYMKAKENFAKAVKYKPLSFKALFYYFATLFPYSYIEALRNIKQKFR